jgi:hypothetical protein
VTAVLTQSDEYDPTMPPATRGHFAATRYQEFFGDVTIDTRGVEEYFAEIFALRPTEEDRALLRTVVSSEGSEPPGAGLAGT